VATGRRTYASVNFVTCHDGFTLTDLVSYNQRHNEANGEGNNDGAAENSSNNWGVEGPTESARVVRLRNRMKRNFLATLMFSQGVRMLLGGDEIDRTQGGNNNAYCQDNEVSWVNWDLDEDAKHLREFVRELITIVNSNPILRRRDFFTGETIPGTNIKDVTWIRPDGNEMTDDDWNDKENRAIGMLLLGRAVDEVDARGRSEHGDSLLLLLNAGVRSLSFNLPRMDLPGRWTGLLNTANPGPWHRDIKTPSINLTAHSTLLIRHADRLRT
jgi:glycogen operon protein